MWNIDLYHSMGDTLGLIMGLFAALLVAMPLVVVLNILGIEQAATSDYIIWHDIYAALLAGGLAYVSSKRALRYLILKVIPPLLNHPAVQSTFGYYRLEVIAGENMLKIRLVL